MITLLGMYADSKSTPVDKTLVHNVYNQFRTDNWEFNCYSQDLVIVTEQPVDGQHVFDSAPCQTQVFANWQPIDYTRRIAKTLRNHYQSVVPHKIVELMGQEFVPIEADKHVEILTSYMPNYTRLSSVMGQIAASPDSPDIDSNIVYTAAPEFELHHDPWRYFKILKDNEVDRRKQNKKTSGSHQMARPINSSNIVFCKSKSTICDFAIGQYHAMYQLSRPTVMEDLLRYQLSINLTTLNQFPYKHVIEPLCDHMRLQVVTFDEFDEFEADYWNDRGTEVNKREFAN